MAVLPYPPRPYFFGVGDGKSFKVTAGAAGTVATVRAGTYLLTITVETVEVTRNRIAAAGSGVGTPLVVGTQMLVRVDADESWSFLSAGAAGVAFFTKVE